MYEIVEGFALQCLKLRFTNEPASSHVLNQNGKGREDWSNLGHGAALAVAGRFAEFPRHKHIREAEAQQDTQDS